MSAQVATAVETTLRDVRYTAGRLGISVHQVYQLVAMKQIAFIKVGMALKRSPVRFRDEDIDDFIARRRCRPAHEEAPVTVDVRKPRHQAPATVLEMPGAMRYAR